MDILNYYQNISVWNRFSKVAVVFDPSHSNDSVLPDDVTYKILLTQLESFTVNIYVYGVNLLSLLGQ